jgi:hypothetical protein
MLGEEIAAHAKAAEGWRLCSADLAAETQRANRAEERAEESEATRSRLAAILTETASALRGPPAPLSSHGWADLSERARDLRASLSEAREVLRSTADHRLRDGSPCWCANYDETLTNSDAWKHAPRCRDARVFLSRSPVSKGGAAPEVCNCDVFDGDDAASADVPCKCCGAPPFTICRHPCPTRMP